MIATVRPFTPEDYEALARVHNVVFPEKPYTGEELRHEDEQLENDARFRSGRFLALADGEVVGFGGYYQNPGTYHPQRFRLEAGVLPGRRGQGVGRALYERVMDALAPLKPIGLRAQARETDERTLRFLGERGFREDQRDWESSLDVAAFDLSPYEDLERRLREDGLSILTAAELSEAHPDDWRARLHELFCDVRQDVPRSEPMTPITLPEFTAWVLEDPVALMDAYFLAARGERLVGMSDLYRSDATDDLFTGLTGVRREERGRGIALALKLRAVRYARSRGAPRIRTDNASTNAPMLAVNARLGFVREPALIGFHKVIDAV